MALKFDGYTIENSNFKITKLEHFSIPVKDMQLYSLANSNRSVIPNVDYPSKVISVEGVIICDSDYDLGAYIDIFKGYLSAKDADLDIDYDSTVRRYVATVGKLDIKRGVSLTSAEFSVDFICTEPFGKETSSTSITNTLNHTSASLNVTPTIGGTAPVQYPLFTITLDALTGTGDYLQVSNDNNDQQILLYGLGLTAGDVIVIDNETRLVTVNGDEVSYYGTFLELEPGSNSITYSDGFDTRTVDIVATYVKRYL